MTSGNAQIRHSQDIYIKQGTGLLQRAGNAADYNAFLDGATKSLDDAHSAIDNTSAGFSIVADTANKSVMVTFSVGATSTALNCPLVSTSSIGVLKNTSTMTNPDKSLLTIDKDIFQLCRGTSSRVGPFQQLASGINTFVLRPNSDFSHTGSCTTPSGTVARISANPTNGEAPLAVSFDASASSTTNGSISSYAWDFGDGATGSGSQTNHTFTTTGTYMVRLTVTDNQSKTAQAQISIVVRGCVADNLFGDQTPMETYSDARYELGTRFQASCAGSITKVRIYTAAQEGGDHSVRIWRESDQQVISGPYTWTFSSGQAGWKEFILPSAATISANVEYIVSVSNGADSYYVATGGALASQQSSASGSLLALQDGGVYSTSLGGMPQSTYGSSNYFRDVYFVPQGTLADQKKQSPHLINPSIRMSAGIVAVEMSGVFSLSMLDMKGRTLAADRRAHDVARIDVNRLQAGTYVAIVKTPTMTWSLPLVLTSKARSRQ